MNFNADMRVQQTALPLLLYDGRSTLGQPVSLQKDERSAMILRRAGAENVSQVLLRMEPELVHRWLEWPEPMRHGERIICFTERAPEPWPDAQLKLPPDIPAATLDAWGREHLPMRAAPTFVARAQQSWRGVAIAFVLLVTILAGLYTWGLPLAARGITALVPHSVDESIGRNALRQIDGRWMKPSQLPQADQERIRAKFLEGVKKQYPNTTPHIQLEFRKSEIGPNAFALPGGIMVMTDELVQMVNSDEVVLGVLGHELGHITRRHGMRQLVQVGVMQGVLSIAFGDYGSLITAAPLILGSMAYSRAHEREADDDSIAFMRANGISPLVMVQFFQAARAYKPPKKGIDGKNTPDANASEATAESPKTQKTPLGFSIISSHPLDEERMEKFRKAAQ